MKNTQQGITLIELMVSVAIVGILTAVAVPAYVEYYAQTYRSEALRELARVANLQEEYFADNNSYASDLPTTFGLKADGTVSEDYLLENGLYRISASSTDWTDEYLLTAIALKGQNKNDSQCARISLSSQGEKSGENDSSMNTGLDCWQ